MSREELLSAFAQYPLSLVILGTIAIIIAGIIYDTSFYLTGGYIGMLILTYLIMTIINSWWFKRGRFEK